MNLNSLENKDDVSADDMGVWKNNGVDTTYVRVTMGKSFVDLVQKRSEKDTKPGTYSVKQIYTTLRRRIKGNCRAINLIMPSAQGNI